MGILIFIIGLTIGSFLNVCIYRIPLGESIAYPPSHCTNCSSEIKAYDLIPIISYIFLGGKCRSCGEKISIKYPILELFTGIMFYFVFKEYGLTIIALKYFIMITFLIVIAVIDLNTQDVYSVTTYSCIAIGIVMMLIEKIYLNEDIWTYVIGLIIGVVVIGGIVFIAGGMGEGDIEIAAICGVFLGWQNMILTILLSFIIGGIVGGVLIILKKKTKRDAIAFGPFLFIGALISLFLGNEIISLYMNFLSFN